MAESSPGFKGFRSLSANFTATPNQFYDRIVGYYEPCVQSVVAILIRSTLGWEDPDTGERRVEAELPMSAFLRPKLSENSVRRGLEAAITAGFIVQTVPSGPRQSARYALRWEDGKAQERAISKQRAAELQGQADEEEDPKNRGAKLGPLNLRPPKMTPHYNSDSETNSESEKKEDLKDLTLNVGEDVNFVGSGGSEQGVFSRAFEQRAALIAAELQDLGSERRHRQLLEICDRHGLGDLVNKALQITRDRLRNEGRRGLVGRPGAYYQSVLLKMLEDRQVFVPKAGEDDADEVRRLIRESIAAGSSHGPFV